LNFRNIELGDKALFEQCTKHAGFTSTDATFAYWYAWAANGRIQFAQDEEAIYIMGNHPERKAFVSPYLKDPEISIRPSMERLYEYLIAGGHEAKLQYVPCLTKHKILQDCGDMMIFEEDRDTCEYVYRSEDLINLAGKKYHSKRNHINTYLKNNTFEYVEYGDEYFDDCIAIHLAWSDDKDVSNSDSTGELSAITRLLKNRKELGVIGCVIKVEGAVRAFSLASAISDEIADVHIEKCHPDYKSLYPIVNREFVKNQLSRFELINREEDMGNPGLRKAKMSYHPVMFNCRYMGVYTNEYRDKKTQ